MTVNDPRPQLAAALAARLTPELEWAPWAGQFLPEAFWARTSGRGVQEASVALVDEARQVLFDICSGRGGSGASHEIFCLCS